MSAPPHRNTYGAPVIGYNKAIRQEIAVSSVPLNEFCNWISFLEAAPSSPRRPVLYRIQKKAVPHFHRQIRYLNSEFGADVEVAPLRSRVNAVRTRLSAKIEYLKDKFHELAVDKQDSELLDMEISISNEIEAVRARIKANQETANASLEALSDCQTATPSSPKTKKRSRESSSDHEDEDPERPQKRQRLQADPLEVWHPKLLTPPKSPEEEILEMHSRDSGPRTQPLEFASAGSDSEDQWDEESAGDYCQEATLHWDRHSVELFAEFVCDLENLFNYIFEANDKDEPEDEANDKSELEDLIKAEFQRQWEEDSQELPAPPSTNLSDANSSNNVPTKKNEESGDEESDDGEDDTFDHGDCGIEERIKELIEQRSVSEYKLTCLRHWMHRRRERERYYLSSHELEDLRDSQRMWALERPAHVEASCSRSCALEVS